MSRLNVANFRHPDGTSDNINLDSSGRVGIGTSSPDSILDLESAAPTITLNDTNGTDDRTTIQCTSGALIITARDGTADGEIIFKKFDGTTTDETLRITNTSNLQFNSGYGSVATAYGVRAWVNFQGTSTVAIRGDGNVSSITDLGTGNYTVNFTTAITDDNYSVVGSVVGSTTSGYHSFVASSGDAFSTSSCEIQIINHSGTSPDLNVIHVAVIR